jgi:hypothetical protein
MHILRLRNTSGFNLILLGAPFLDGRLDHSRRKYALARHMLPEKAEAFLVVMWFGRWTVCVGVCVCVCEKKR